MKNEEPDVKDVKYGIIVVDPKQEGDMLDILHFVGYWDEPTIDDANALREELRTDEEFGLTDIIDTLQILPAPADIVKHYVETIISDIDEQG